MSRLLKAAVFGLLIGLAGILVSFVPLAHDLEEDIGLALLFKLRGARKAPSEVVVVSIDRESAERLRVSHNPDRWPRSLHAELIRNLVRAGAGVIVLDIYFIEPRSKADDASLAEAIREAGNVILAEPLRVEEVRSFDGAGASVRHTVVKRLKTVEPISYAAFATAPFVLPRIPVRVNQYWAFQTSAGDLPTFPMVAFKLYGLSVYDRFRALLANASPSHVDKLPAAAAAAFTSRGAPKFIRDIRGIFESDPTLAGKMMLELERSRLAAAKDSEYRLLKSLVRMYGGENRRYLNFYGPPRTITTLPYDQALSLGRNAGHHNAMDLKGKAVFIGYSEILLAERQDSFHTVFSLANGVFISGVEIAATAFANLLDESAVETISSRAYLLIILAWGIAIGLVSRTMGTMVAAVALGIVSALYLGTAEYQFKASGLWYPIVVPLFLQMPLGFVGALLLNYFETNKERQNVRRALGYYVPSEVVNQLARNIADIRSGGQTVYGACLFADAADYTNLSETMGAGELSDLMHKYFEMTFEPIKQNGGLVVEVKGDSILAIWKAQRPDSKLGKQACAAALGLAKAVRRFNQAVPSGMLPTRIAVHAGEIFVGNIGAGDHYEYGVTGDTVNTASRLDGLNKYLGTQILVSRDAVGDCDEFLIREAGSFLLKGKTQPIIVHELLEAAAHATDQQIRACAAFAEACAAFKQRAWNDAAGKFHQCINILGRDNLSSFYLKICEKYQKDAPGESWTGVISIDEK
jgi:adenylate cyclase